MQSLHVQGWDGAARLPADGGGGEVIRKKNEPHGREGGFVSLTRCVYKV